MHACVLGNGIICGTHVAKRRAPYCALPYRMVDAGARWAGSLQRSCCRRSVRRIVLRAS